MENKFNDAITLLLSERLKQFVVSEAKLNIHTCTEIFQIIFGTLTEVFETSNVNISNEAMNYIAQEYYDSITVNNGHELDPNIFSQRAKIENIETKELALLAVMFKGTYYASPLLHEIKRRS